MTNIKNASDVAATTANAQIHKTHLNNTMNQGATQAPKTGREQREQEIIRISQMPTQYWDWGRRGKPCPVFPDLTVSSNVHDIQRAASNVCARSVAIMAERYPKLPSDDDPLVKKIFGDLCQMCAEEYVKGLRENAQAAEVQQ